MCRLIQINHAFINIVTSILGGRRWRGIWRIRWIPTRYWRRLRLWLCFLWRTGLLLKNLGKLRWINDLIVQWRRHMYQQWLQSIAPWVNVLDIKELVITRSVLWRAVWLLTNRGQLMWIDDWIIQWSSHRYHRQW